MGIYLNPGNKSFQISLNSKIYIDKSNLISYTNSVISTAQRFVCVSRPRRFGKSVTAEMLAAYYGRDADSKEQFEHLLISKDSSFRLKDYRGNLLLVGVNYNRKTKKHECMIEQYQI